MDPSASDGRQTGSDSGPGSCCPETAKSTELYLGSVLGLPEADAAHHSPAVGFLETTTAEAPTAAPLGRQLPHSRHTPPKLTTSAVGCTSTPSSMSVSEPLRPGKHFTWPSPPLGPGDIDSVAQYEVPASNGSYSPYPDTPTTSITWHSSAAALYHQSPTSGEIYHPEPSTTLASCTPSTPIYPLMTESSSLLPAFGGHMYSPTDSGDLGLQQAQFSFGSGNSMAASTDLACAGMAQDGYVTHPFGMPATPESLSATPKNDEPYAKLIFRALMSKPDHRMTLQEIYQWFRDNTNKADGDKDKKGGWQNSIRHNLSMNGAFVKPDPKDDGGESKRSNVWVLEQFAIEKGVESTTRYRQLSTRRSASKASSHHYDSHGRRGPGPYSSIRSQSGRRGGCATRNARLREQHQHQQPLPSELPPYAMMFGHPISPPRSAVLSNSIQEGLMGSGSMMPSPTGYGYSHPGFDSDPADVYMPDPSMGHYAVVGGELGGLHTRFGTGPTGAAAAAAAAAAATSTPTMYFGTQFNCMGDGGGPGDQYNSRQGHAEYDPQSQLVPAGGGATTAPTAIDGGGLCDW